MKDFLAVAGTMLGLFVIGLFDSFRQRRKINTRLKFTTDYLNRFDKTAVTILHKRNEIDQSTIEDYTWLVENVDAIQAELGAHGIMAAYRRAYESSYIANYALILNTLPELREGRAHSVTVNHCTDALVKHRGQLKRQLDGIASEIRNPFAWLRRGVQFIVTLPLRLASWVGVISPAGFDALTESSLIKWFSSLVALLGIIGSIFSIVSGWEPTLKFISRLLHGK